MAFQQLKHAEGNPLKTYRTALVLIPSPELWEPIQAIRRRYDRQLRRWMPHITLLYPFRPLTHLGPLQALLAAACTRLAPFELQLAGVGEFAHGHGQFTLWLAPEPRTAVLRVHEALWRLAPDCDELRRHRGGYTPHLSLGQIRGPPRLLRCKAELQAAWHPLCVPVTAVSLIARDDPPDDVFRVHQTYRLGSDEQRWQ